MGARARGPCNMIANGSGPAAVATAVKARGGDQLASEIGPEDNPSERPARVAISTQRTAEDWRRIIADDLGRAVEGIIAAGLHLQEAKDEVDHGDWLPLLRSLKIGERTAQMLMKIAANEVLANPNHWFAFPTSWRTLSELATLPPKLLEAKIIDGTITPEIERKDVTALKGKAPAASRLAVDAPDPPALKATRAELIRENEALRAHNEDLEAGREIESEASLSIAEAKRRLEIENDALRSEVEELKVERDQLRERVAELEAALAASDTVQAAKPKRDRPKGSKNKPKPPADNVAVPAPVGSDPGPMPDFLRRAS